MFDMDVDIEDFPIRHTGEHLLIGELVRRYPGAKVVRVVHEESLDKAFIKYDGEIKWEDVIQSCIDANQKILEGYDIDIEIFDSLESAKKAYPDLRAYEERLKNRGFIRVVKIGDFDFSACKNPHVRNTREIHLIIVDSLSRVRRGLYEVRFYTGIRAIRHSVKLADILYRVSNMVGSTHDQLIKRIDNLYNEYNDLKARLNVITRDMLNRYPIRIGKYRVLFIDVPGIDLKYSMSNAPDIMRRRNVDVLVILTEGKDKHEVFIASKDLDIEDLKSRIRDVAGGRGGGRRGMYFGYVDDPSKFRELISRYFKIEL